MVMGATLCGRGPAAAAIAAAMHNQSEQVLNSFTLNLYFTWREGFSWGTLFAPKDIVILHLRRVRIHLPQPQLVDPLIIVRYLHRVKDARLHLPVELFLRYYVQFASHRRREIELVRILQLQARRWHRSEEHTSELQSLRHLVC